MIIIMNKEFGWGAANRAMMVVDIDSSDSDDSQESDGESGNAGPDASSWKKTGPVFKSNIDALIKTTEEEEENEQLQSDPRNEPEAVYRPEYDSDPRQSYGRGHRSEFYVPNGDDYRGNRGWGHYEDRRSYRTEFYVTHEESRYTEPVYEERPKRMTMTLGGAVAPPAFAPAPSAAPARQPEPEDFFVSKASESRPAPGRFILGGKTAPTPAPSDRFRPVRTQSNVSESRPRFSLGGVKQKDAEPVVTDWKKE